MASRLQKTLGTVDSVASVGRPTPERDFVSQAIQGAAQVTEGVIGGIGKAKGRALGEELTGLGQEISAIEEGKDLEDATERFKRLKKAKEQGILGDGMINIEAEKILKEKIGKSSLFAPELRAEAQRILGFDPSGSAIQRLFGKSGRTSPSRPLSAGEKRRAKAEDFASLGLGNADDIEKLIAKSELGEIQTQFASDQAKLGEIGSAEVLNASLDNVDSYVADATSELLTTISQGGFNAVDSTTRVATLNQSKEAAWSRHRKALTDGNINLSASKLGEQRRLFDQKFAPIEEMFKDDATMEVILTKQNRALVAQASINGFDMFPGLASVNASIGQAGVTEYFSMMSNIQDPAQLELIKRINPQFAAIAENRQQASRAMRGSFNRIMGIPSTEADPVIPGLDDVVKRNLIKQAKEPEIRNRIVNTLQAASTPFKDFGDYGQKGVRANVTQEEIKYIKGRWGTEFTPLTSRIATNLKSNDDVELAVVNGRLKATVNILKVNSQRVGQFGVNLAVPSALQTDIKRLNAMNALVQNGWSDDVGEPPAGFLERTLNGIETLRADQGSPNEPDEVGTALEAVLQSPTPENLEAIRKLDPELFNMAQSILASQGGGDTSGK